MSRMITIIMRNVIPHLAGGIFKALYLIRENIIKN